MRAHAWLAIVGVGALCALPAAGDGLGQALSNDEIHALTLIDTVPTRASLDVVLQATDVGSRIGRLKEIALATTVDFGIRLRAIRALPHYCGVPCRSNGTTGDPAHLALRAIFATLDRSDLSGPSILRMRAAIEALGATKSNLPEDVQLVGSYLDHDSRDVRLAAARGLGAICNKLAKSWLKGRLPREEIRQVVNALNEAVAALEPCP